MSKADLAYALAFRAAAAVARLSSPGRDLTVDPRARGRSELRKKNISRPKHRVGPPPKPPLTSARLRSGPGGSVAAKTKRTGIGFQPKPRRRQGIIGTCNVAGESRSAATPHG